LKLTKSVIFVYGFTFKRFVSEFYNVVLSSQQKSDVINCQNSEEIIISYNKAFWLP